MGDCPDIGNRDFFYVVCMRNPEPQAHRYSPRRAGPGQTVLTGLAIVAAGLLVALRGAYLLASAMGPAGSTATPTALSGFALLTFGALIECLGVAVFSRRFVSRSIFHAS